MGGITRPADAIEFLLVGATAVQVGTALFADPGLPESCVELIASYLRENGAESVESLIGALDVPPERGVIRAGRGVRSGARRGGAT